MALVVWATVLLALVSSALSQDCSGFDGELQPSSLSDTVHQLTTVEASEARTAALCHVACLEFVISSSMNGTNSTVNGTATNSTNGSNSTAGGNSTAEDNTTLMPVRHKVLVYILCFIFFTSQGVIQLPQCSLLRQVRIYCTRYPQSVHTYASRSK